MIPPIRWFVAFLIAVVAMNTVEALTLTSSAFDNEGNIPVQYTCDSDGSGTSNGVNPPLQIADVPPEAVSLVLLVIDASTTPLSSHWIVFNIDPLASTISENSIPSLATAVGMPPGFPAPQGRNFNGENVYAGPCPPLDPAPETHEYIFTLYALSRTLSLSSGATYDEVVAAMEGSILEVALLRGYYYPGVCAMAMVENGVVGPFPGCALICNDGYQLEGARCVPLLEQRCGNGWVEEGEQCDDDNVDGNTCTTIPGGFTGGLLRCNVETCQFDSRDCVTEIAPGSVELGGRCTEDVQCRIVLSCVVQSCRDVEGFLSEVTFILDDPTLTRTQMIVLIAMELRSFLTEMVAVP